LRIGLIDDMKIGTPVQDNVRAAVHAAARALEAAGAVVTPVAPFLTQDMLSGMNTFFEARSYNDLKAMSPEQRARALPFIVEWCTGKAAGFSGADVMAGYSQVMAMREAAVRTVAAFDFLISPTSPITAYAAELPSPNNDPHNALPHIAFTVAYNMSEQPASSLQWDFSEEGLPIGIQIVGQRFDDLGVMRLSRALEQLRPAQRPWPQAPQKR
jgi:aspartyl-tRNA(Asn)/glutamyl-tRNA(Gln) amidotransferase subunit A